MTLILLVVAAGCGGSPAAQKPAHPTPAAAAVPKRAKALRKVSVILNWIPTGVTAPLYLAVKDGLFTREGLDVKIVPGKGSGSAVQQLAAGHYQFAFADGGVTMQYRAKGMPVRMVYDVFPKGSAAVIFPKKLDYKSPRDLEGHSIAVAPSGPTAKLLPAFLKKVHVNLSKVKIVTASPSTLNSLLLDHSVTAIASQSNLQHAHLLAKGLNTAWFNFSDYGFNLPGAGIVTTNKVIASHPALVRSFLLGVAQALKATKADPRAAIDAESALSRYPSFNAKSELASLKDSIPYWTDKLTQGHPYGWMPPRDWTNAARILERYTGMKPVDASTAYTDRFIP